METFAENVAEETTFAVAEAAVSEANTDVTGPRLNVGVGTAPLLLGGVEEEDFALLAVAVAEAEGVETINEAVRDTPGIPPVPDGIATTFSSVTLNLACARATCRFCGSYTAYAERRKLSPRITRFLVEAVVGPTSILHWGTPSMESFAG